eukprot:3738510-Alexandrium_andersonii.AAC.1
MSTFPAWNVEDCFYCRYVNSQRVLLHVGMQTPSSTFLLVGNRPPGTPGAIVLEPPWIRCQLHDRAEGTMPDSC